MKDLQNLATSELVDLLAKQTEIYLKITAHGASEEDYAKCNLAIKALVKELDQRKNEKAGATIARPPDYI